jgi:hypothetical protein
MKNLFLLFVWATLFFALTGCAKVDNECSWSFKILNQTSLNITIAGSATTESIAPGGEGVISQLHAMCGENVSDPGDRFQENDIMDITNNPNISIQVKAGKELMPNEIFRRNHWAYTHTSKGNATYTLTLTEELIETLLPENAPQGRY